jgi:hypothetical protein
MTTYRIDKEWILFQNYVEEYLHHFDPNSFCFLHKGKVIYLRFTDNRLGEILSKEYDLIPCEPPCIPINGGWIYSGNPYLFPN